MIKYNYHLYNNCFWLKMLDMFEINCFWSMFQVVNLMVLVYFNCFFEHNSHCSMVINPNFWGVYIPWTYPSLQVCMCKHRLIGMPYYTWFINFIILVGTGILVGGGRSNIIYPLLYCDSLSLGIQSPCQVMSKGCTITSETQGI